MGGFMVPVVYHGNALVIDGDDGNEVIELSAFTKAEHRQIEALVRRTDRAKGASVDLEKIPGFTVRQFFRSRRVNGASIIDGWIGYASAPGYLDRTDPQIFDTEAEAIAHAREAAGEDEDDQPSTLGGKVKP